MRFWLYCTARTWPVLHILYCQNMVSTAHIDISVLRFLTSFSWQQYRTIFFLYFLVCLFVWWRCIKLARLNIFDRQAEESDWQTTKSRPNSSENFTEFRNRVNEDWSNEHWISRTFGKYIYLFIPHIALSESACSVSICRLPYRMMN